MAPGHLELSIFPKTVKCPFRLPSWRPSSVVPSISSLANFYSRFKTLTLMSPSSRKILLSLPLVQPCLMGLGVSVSGSIFLS